MNLRYTSRDSDVKVAVITPREISRNAEVKRKLVGSVTQARIAAWRLENISRPKSKHSLAKVPELLRYISPNAALPLQFGDDASAFRHLDSFRLVVTNRQLVLYRQ